MAKKKDKSFVELCEKYGVDANLIPEILTYEEACKVTKRDPKMERDAMQQTMVIIDAFCQQAKWKADYKKTDQRRHFPIFEMTKTGLVFSYTHFVCWFSLSYACVGAPFVLPTRDHARFVGQHFLPHYKKWMLNYKVK